MQVIHHYCCGLDVHKKTVVACILITSQDGSVQKKGRTFSTMTVELLALVDWLHASQVPHVALRCVQECIGIPCSTFLKRTSRSS